LKQLLTVGYDTTTKITTTTITSTTTTITR